MSDNRFSWWNDLRHGGLLLDALRLANVIPEDPVPLTAYNEDRVRRRFNQFGDDPEKHRGEFVAFVLEATCGFAQPLGKWFRGSDIKTEWSRRAITGESIRPRQLWIGKNDAKLPVFIDDQQRLGIGRGRRTISHVLQWLRQGKQQLAVVTNGQQWRLLFAGLDYEAFCEWDADSWFAEGTASPVLTGFRALLSPRLWTPEKKDEPCPLLAAINDSRKGQSDLSQVLGERVRKAVEILVRGHAPALNQMRESLAAQDIYRAGVRIIMRMVVVLFAESREGLLPRDNPIFHNAYSLQGLREQLERTPSHRLKNGYAAWPRVLALFRLIHDGSCHESLPVTSYGGALFAPGNSDADDGMAQSLAIFENACFRHDIMSDAQVREILELLSRTKVRIRQGRASTPISSPVDFSSLDSEYIGILYEGLLDFELRTAPDDQPVVFLAVGNQPALPLATLEAMDDRAIKNLLEKMKDTSSDDGDESEEGESGDGEGDEAEPELMEEDATEQETGENDDALLEEATATDDGDVRQSTRARADDWARRACEIGNLIKKPPKSAPPERQMRYQAALDEKARQITPTVILPSEWYLVRWGGTRKGAGTFYTRPQLAVPTVHRTLRPLAYDAPKGKDGEPDENAPVELWTPKTPEEILNLKVCDPACGSGSFPLAALRFLTEAIYSSLHHHGRIHDHGGRSVIDLIKNVTGDHTLAAESLPCRPDDDEFEPRTKAMLRRYVVERCIYGVDIDPLAVELCRLSLWIETLDRRLPFTFLDHKIKCGNSLVGTWFDQFQHYPAMAWSREGGDKNHTNGIHFPKEQWTKTIRNRVADVRLDLITLIDGAPLLHQADLSTIHSAHDDAERSLHEIHSLGIHEAQERARRYQELRQSEVFQKMKADFDFWCALWFWPPDMIEEATLPIDFAERKSSAAAREIARNVAAEHHFFHWELEFPDAFGENSHGFDAVLGNPPWETLQPNSKEFFSAIDPIYRSYGNQEARRRQTALFSDRRIEYAWLTYNAFYKAFANWMKFAGCPFGETHKPGHKTEHNFPLGDPRGNRFATSATRHAKWKRFRQSSHCYADPVHVFQHQGGGKPYTHKLFLEVAYALTREEGRFGLIVPSALYNDHGTGHLRTLFIDHCRWEWLFGFENRDKIFDIHRSFKFNPVILQRGGHTDSIRTAFMRRKLSDWEDAETIVTAYPRTLLLTFSPHMKAILEIQSPKDLSTAEAIYRESVLLGDLSTHKWHVAYQQGDFNLTSDSKRFANSLTLRTKGKTPDPYGTWHVEHKSLHPLYEGKMIWQFDYAYSAYGIDGQRTWRELDWADKVISARHLIDSQDYASTGGVKLVFRDVSSPSNRRTFIATCVPDYPCCHKVPILCTAEVGYGTTLPLAAIVNSLVFDYIVRMRFAPSGGGGSLVWSMLSELPAIKNTLPPAIEECLIDLVLQLLGDFRAFAPLILARQREVPGLTILPATAPLARLRLRCLVDAIVFHAFGLTRQQAKWIIADCDHPAPSLAKQGYARELNTKAFWRVDKTLRPELRHPILAFVAFCDLLDRLTAGGDQGATLRCFTDSQRGWHIPQTLVLNDYELGRDASAEEAMPVASEFTPLESIVAHSADDLRKWAIEKHGDNWESHLPVREARTQQRAFVRESQLPLFGE